MFFLKKFFSKKFEASELEDILYENGVEPEFADIIIETLSGKYQETEIKETLKKKINEKDFETSRLKLENEMKRLTKIVNNEVS